MVPTSAIGLLLFVVLLAPGLAYVLRHEQSMPAKEHSAFRESLRVLFASIVCLGVTTAAASAVARRSPGIRPDAQAFLTDPAAYVRENFASAAWWTVAVVLTATLLGFTAADPRLLDRLAKLRTSRFGVTLLGRASISDVSGWYKAIVEHAPEAEDSEGDPEVFVGALMDDGSYVRGYLVSHSTRAVDNGDRDLVITLAEVDTPEGETKIVGSTLSIISARNIRRLDVTHILAGDAAASADLPVQRVHATAE